jgi:membrane fusion protein (multidrug efflux system)
VTDSARLEVDQASHPIQTSIEGKIIEISMKLGQEISEGTILARLDDKLHQLKRKESQDRYNSLSEQLSALREQISQEETLLEEEGKIAHIRLQEAQSKYQEGEIAAVFAEDEVKRLDKLYTQGALSQSVLLRAKSEAEKQRASAEALRISLDRLKGECQVQENKRQTRLSQLRQQLLQIQGEIQNSSTIVEQLDFEIEKHRIKAPVAGTIAEAANINVGMFVDEGFQIGSILPMGRLRVVAFFWPAVALGKIYPGQKAYLRVKGFSWLEFGRVAARVQKVSQEIRQGQLRVDLEIIDKSSSIPLQHGQPVRVEIETERITPAILVLRKAGNVFNPKPPSVSINNHSLTVEVAATKAARQQALMFREVLPPNHGMLFVFPQEGPLSFWMKDTLIPLSIAFINAEGIILKIMKMDIERTKNEALFRNYATDSQAPAMYALEVNKGWFENHGIGNGSRVKGLNQLKIGFVES